MLLLFVSTVCFAGWPAGSKPALDGPAAGLVFGMPPEQGLAATPSLVPAFDVSLPPKAFDALVASHPELIVGRSTGQGGNRWSEHKSVSSGWPVVAGAKWSVEFDDRLGLHRVRMRYPEETATLAALRRAWGEPAIQERWTIWLAPGIRATWTGCFQPTQGQNECTLELMPYRPLEALVQEELFPGGRSLVGTARSGLPAGTPCDDHCTLVQLLPYEFSSGFVPLELTWGADGKVESYRSQLDYTYATSSRDRVLAALVKTLGGPGEPSAGGCLAWPAERVVICEAHTVFTITVGTEP